MLLPPDTAAGEPHFPDAADLGSRERTLLRARMESLARQMLDAETPPGVHVRPARVSTGGEGAGEMHGPRWAQIVAPAELSPFHIALDEALCCDLADAMLGSAPTGTAALTSVDEAVVGQWVKQFAARVLAALGQRVDIASARTRWMPQGGGRVEPHDRPPAESALLEFQATCGRDPGRLLVQFDLPALKEALTRSRPPTVQSAPDRLTAELHEVPVRVVATMGSATISIQDLSALAVGDIIRLSGAAVPVARIIVNDQELFLGRAGVVDERLAVQITSARGDQRSDAP